MDNILTFARSFFGTNIGDGSSTAYVDRLSPITDCAGMYSEHRASEVENAQALIIELNKCVQTLGDKDDQITSLYRQIRTLTENLARQTADVRELHKEHEALEAQAEGTQTQLNTMEGLYQSEKALRINAQTEHKQSLQYHHERICQLEILANDNDVRASTLEIRCNQLETYEEMIHAIRECEGGKSRRKRLRRESFDSVDSGSVAETVRFPTNVVTGIGADLPVVL